MQVADSLLAARTENAALHAELKRFKAAVAELQQLKASAHSCSDVSGDLGAEGKRTMRCPRIVCRRTLPLQSEQRLQHKLPLTVHARMPQSSDGVLRQLSVRLAKQARQSSVHGSRSVHMQSATPGATCFARMMSWSNAQQLMNCCVEA